MSTNRRAAPCGQTDRHDNGLQLHFQTAVRKHLQTDTYMDKGIKYAQRPNTFQTYR
jgi:hypothetical protein